MKKEAENDALMAADALMEAKSRDDALSSSTLIIGDGGEHIRPPTIQLASMDTGDDIPAFSALLKVHPNFREMTAPDIRHQTAGQPTTANNGGGDPTVTSRQTTRV